MKISDSKSQSSEDHGMISYVQLIMDEAFEKETSARGLAAGSRYFDHTVRVNGKKFWTIR